MTPEQTNHGQLSTLVDSLLDDFERAWRGREPPRIEEFVSRAASAQRPLKQQRALLEQLVVVDMEFRFRKWSADTADEAATLEFASKDSTTPRLEDYRSVLEAYCGPPASWPPRLFFSEYHIRQRYGDRPLLDEYPDRFPEIPDWPKRLKEMESSAELSRAGESDSRVGTVLAGDYELLREIARGGMGIVYEAHQRSLKRTVAVKMILDGQLASEAHRQRFHAEARAAAGLNHPHIVPVYEVGQDRGQHFFSMGFVDGANLSARVAKDGPLSPRDAAHLIELVASAVHYAHQRGIVHRDLKPQNVLLTRDGRPMVTDFGLAKQVDQVDGLTISGQFVGTPSFMSPEQAQGQLARIGPVSDVYGLGAILYYLLTGRPPFHTGSVAETLKQVIDREPVSPRRLNPVVDRDLETVCLKCLEKDPTQRYATAADLAADLRRYLNGDNILARPIGAAEHVWRWCRRQPSTAALVLVSALLLLVGVPLALWYQGQITASRALAHAARADQELANQRAHASLASSRAFQYNAAINEARQDITAARAGWTRRAREKLKLAASLDTPVRQAAEVRTELARCLMGIDALRLPDLNCGMQAGCVAFSKQGDTLAVGQFKAWVFTPCSVQLYDVASGKLRDTVAFTGSRVINKGAFVQDGCRFLEFSPDGRWLATGARSGWVHVWDLSQTPAVLHSLHPHEDELSALLFSPDSQRLYSAGAVDKKVLCYQLSDDQWKEAEKFLSQNGLDSLALFPAQNALVLLEDRDRFSLVSPDRLQLIRRIDHPCGSIAWTPWGANLLLGEDWGLEVYDLARHRVQRTFYDPASANGDLWAYSRTQFSDDGSLLSTITRSDRKVRIWDTLSGKVVFAVSPDGDVPLDAALAPDGRRLAIVGEHDVQLYDISGSLGRSHASGRLGLPDSIAWHPAEGRTAVAAGLPLEYLTTTIQDSRLVASFVSNGIAVVHRPSRRIATSHKSGSTQLWDFSGDAPTCVVNLPTTSSQLAFSGDGQTLWGIENKARLWSWTLGDKKPRPWFDSALGNALTGRSDLNCMDAGDGSVIVGTRLGELLRIDDKSPSPTRIDTGIGNLMCVALAPDERLVVCGSETGELCVIDRTQGDKRASLPRHADSVSSLNFNTEGTLLVSTSHDRTVRLWLRTGNSFQELLTLHFTAAVLEARFHPLENTLALRVNGETFVRVLPLTDLQAELGAAGVGWPQPAVQPKSDEL